MKVDRRIVRAALGVVLAAGAGWALLNRDQLDLSALEASVQALGLWAPAAFIGFFAVATVFLVPGSLFGLAGGVLFGPLWGTLWNLVGGTLGATLAFLSARYVSGDWLARRTGGRLGTIVESAEAEGWRFVALMRLVPVVPFNLLNYALGLTRIPLSHFVLATFVCMLPGAAAYAWLGHAGRAAIVGDGNALRYALLGLALLAAIAFLPRLVRRVRVASSGWITLRELDRDLSAAGPLLVIDVREPEEFEGPLGHIAAASNIPLGDLQARLDDIRRSDARKMVLVCKTDKRSAKAATVMRDAGLQNVVVLRGGMEAWRAAHPSVQNVTPNRASSGTEAA